MLTTIKPLIKYAVSSVFVAKNERCDVGSDFKFLKPKLFKQFDELKTGEENRNWNNDAIDCNH